MFFFIFKEWRKASGNRCNSSTLTGRSPDGCNSARNAVRRKRAGEGNAHAYKISAGTTISGRFGRRHPKKPLGRKNENRRWKLAAAAAALFAGVTTAQAQDTRMYAFSSGALTIGKGVLQNFAPMDPPIVIPVGFYVIKHPKGNIALRHRQQRQADPGHRTTGPPGLQGLKPAMTPDVAIDVQLKKIGLTPGRHQVRRVQPPAPGPWRQRRQVPELHHRRAEVRNPECVLARARHRRPVHHRRRHAAARAEQQLPERAEDDSARGRSGSVRRRLAW